jgi:hypothetical protein
LNPATSALNAVTCRALSGVAGRTDQTCVVAAASVAAPAGLRSDSSHSVPSAAKAGSLTDPSHASFTGGAFASASDLSQIAVVRL